MRHPNIVAIHEVGERLGRPFFSMDFIAGRNLAAALRTSLPSPRQAAAWTLALAEALAHAHGHSVIHRDLKPANVLLDNAGAPHLTDFGLARVLDDSAELTLTGAALGTASYMAPEQAAGRGADINPATDVHGLGAVLYHCLTGRPPFLADSVLATLRQVVETDPVAPRRLNPGVPADLETLCLKCLEKSPARRYASASELAAELRRFLAGEPIRARPLSPPERLWRAARRRPVVAALSLALAVTTLGGIAGIVWQWRQTLAAKRQLATLAADTKSEAAEAALSRDDSPRALQLLAEAARTAPHEGLAPRRLAALLTQRDFPLPAAPPLRLGQPAADLVFSADGRRVATVTQGGEVRLWDAATSAPQPASLSVTGEVHAAQFSADGTSLATGDYDGTVHPWNANAGRSRFHLILHTGPVSVVAFSPDSRRLLSASFDQQAILWDVATGKPAVPVMAHPDTVLCAAVSPDGRLIATGCMVDRTARVWDARTGLLLTRPLPHDGWVMAVDFSPDGQCLVTASTEGSARLWDVRTGQLLTDPLRHGERVWTARFSPDGLRLVTGSRDGHARVWFAPDLPPPRPTGCPRWPRPWAARSTTPRTNSTRAPSTNFFASAPNSSPARRPTPGPVGRNGSSPAAPAVRPSQPPARRGPTASGPARQQAGAQRSQLSACLREINPRTGLGATGLVLEAALHLIQEHRLACGRGAGLLRGDAVGMGSAGRWPVVPGGAPGTRPLRLCPHHSVIPAREIAVRRPAGDDNPRALPGAFRLVAPTPPHVRAAERTAGAAGWTSRRRIEVL